MGQIERVAAPVVQCLGLDQGGLVVPLGADEQHEFLELRNVRRVFTIGRLIGEPHRVHSRLDLLLAIIAPILVELNGAENLALLHLAKGDAGFELLGRRLGRNLFAEPDLADRLAPDIQHLYRGSSQQLLDRLA